jgi:hypothetical protein
LSKKKLLLLLLENDDDVNNYEENDCQHFSLSMICETARASAFNIFNVHRFANSSERQQNEKFHRHSEKKK